MSTKSEEKILATFCAVFIVLLFVVCALLVSEANARRERLVQECTPLPSQDVRGDQWWQCPDGAYTWRTR